MNLSSLEKSASKKEKWHGARMGWLIKPVGVEALARMLLISALMMGCARSRIDQHVVQQAYNRAKNSLLQEDFIELDVIWIIQDILRIESDKELQALVDEYLERVDEHPYLRMVVPDAPRIELPENPGRGITRYINYIKAPFGTPRERAIQFITEYLSNEESGYILTHQLAVLIWSRQTGLDLPPDLMGRKAEVLQRIHDEQISDLEASCVDLYAERTALLLRYGKPYPEQAGQWIRRLIELQLPDGRWPPSSPRIYYDGQFASSKIPPSHTTALAMLAFKVYISDY